MKSVMNEVKNNKEISLVAGLGSAGDIENSQCQFDVLDLFDNVTIEKSSSIDDDNRLTQEDKDEMNKLEERLNKTRESYLSYKESIDGKELVKFNPENTYSDFTSKYFITMLHVEFMKEMSHFVSSVYRYFAEKYSISVENNISKQYRLDNLPNSGLRYYNIDVLNEEFCLNNLCANIVIDDIFEQTGGRDLSEKAVLEVKEGISKGHFAYNLSVKGRVVSVGNLWREKRWDNKWEALVYRYADEMKSLFYALSHFEFDKIEWSECFSTYKGNYSNESWLIEQKFETLNKIHSIKFFKNGKIQIKFKDSATALEFAEEYCGYSE